MRFHSQHTLLLLFFIALVVGCADEQVAPVKSEGEAEGRSASDGCARAKDGVCDEPTACALGTDSTDCTRACDTTALPATHLACVSRSMPPAPAPTPPEHGSHGGGGAIGTWDGSIEARGEKPDTEITRYFRAHVPERYDPTKPTPLVYMLSGFTVDMYALEAYTELNRTAELNNFIVVYPAPQFRDFGRDIGSVYAWHVYTNEWTPGRWEENPDLDFIRKLTARMKQLYNIDRTRVFATGHSRGAGLSIMLAFLAPDLIAGFCAEMGFIDVNQFDSFIGTYHGRRMPGVLVHGTADQDVPVKSSDAIAKVLTAGGWVKDTDFRYFRLPGVVHQWQPQYNETFWQFLREHPLPIEAAAP